MECAYSETLQQNKDDVQLNPGLVIRTEAALSTQQVPVRCFALRNNFIITQFNLICIKHLHKGKIYAN